MRAILLHEFGPPDRLQPAEVAAPVAGASQVEIDVEWSGITFVETQLRAGRPPHPSMLPSLPVVLGNGVGGVVATVGDDADPGLVGRRVVSSLGGSGGYAERAVAPSSAVVEVPAALGMPEAVALLADGRTALLAFRQTQPGPGDRVLVLAAGGGVGSLLVQLARDAGAAVIAAAGGESKLALARSLGAEAALDYSREDWTDAVNGVDVVVDGVGGEIGRAAFQCLRPGGRLMRLGMASGALAAVSDDDAAERGVALVGRGGADPGALHRASVDALALGAAGELVPTIGQTFPLERASDAHAAIEARTTLGKTLLHAR
jgi:NADPH2:quinone reductase